jgi:hypothetical protein
VGCYQLVRAKIKDEQDPGITNITVSSEYDTAMKRAPAQMEVAHTLVALDWFPTFAHGITMTY